MISVLLKNEAGGFRANRILNFGGGEARFEQDVKATSGHGARARSARASEEADASELFRAGEKRAFLRERDSTGPTKFNH